MESMIKATLMEAPDLELSLDRNVHKDRKPKVKDPELVGYFSIDGERKYEKGLSKLKYMAKPTGEETVMNLNKGTFVEWNHDRNVVRFPFYEYLLDHKKMLDNLSGDGTAVHDFGFVAERSTLMDIFLLGTFDMIKKARVFVTRLSEGNIFIRSVRHPYRLPKEISQSGHRYEQLMLSDSPTEEPNTENTVVESEEFTLVMEMAIAKHRIMFSSESDGILANRDEPKTAIEEKETEEETVEEMKKRNFIRLITSNKHYKEKGFRRWKSRHIWPKLFFSRADKVILGIKNDGGIVTKNSMQSKNSMIKNGLGWSVSSNFKMMDAFFEFIKNSYLKHLYNESYGNINDVSMEMLFQKEKNQRFITKVETPMDMKPVRQTRIEMKAFTDNLEKKKRELKLKEDEELVKKLDEMMLTKKHDNLEHVKIYENANSNIEKNIS